MLLALALTVVALAGIAIGARLGEPRWLSDHLSAACGGLLFGIAVFWLGPEIAETGGWLGAALISIGACCALLVVDRMLTHAGYSPRQGVILPLLAATAVHSFLDGWSVRIVAPQSLAPLGLALHKLPEGIALGWITRRSMGSHAAALGASAGVELLTLVGAAVEPWADVSGAARFGPWWTACVIGVIAGAFLFAGVHAILPARRRPDVAVWFVVTAGAAAALALARR